MRFFTAVAAAATIIVAAVSIPRNVTTLVSMMNFMNKATNVPTSRSNLNPYLLAAMIFACVCMMGKIGMNLCNRGNDAARSFPNRRR